MVASQSAKPGYYPASRVGDFQCATSVWSRVVSSVVRGFGVTHVLQLFSAQKFCVCSVVGRQPRSPYRPSPPGPYVNQNLSQQHNTTADNIKSSLSSADGSSRSSSNNRDIRKTLSLPSTSLPSSSSSSSCPPVSTPTTIKLLPSAISLRWLCVSGCSLCLGGWPRLFVLLWLLLLLA